MTSNNEYLNQENETLIKKYKLNAIKNIKKSRICYTTNLYSSCVNKPQTHTQAKSQVNSSQYEPNKLYKIIETSK